RLYVQTDPVRDCSGNPVPDGTVVSFTKMDSGGKTTVDVPVKRGVARVELPVKGNARVFAASGVVTGNELNGAGRQVWGQVGECYAGHSCWEQPGSWQWLLGPRTQVTCRRLS